MARTTSTKSTATPATDTDQAAPVVDQAATDTDATATPTAAELIIVLATSAPDPQRVLAVYATASTGDKTKIRNAITSGMMAAVTKADITLAQAYAAIGDALKSAAATPKADTDPNRVVADRIIALLYAAHRLAMGDVTPAGMDADKIDTDAVATMVKSYTDGDRDAVTNDQAAVGNKLAATKITRATERGDVETHLATAFDGMPVGTKLTVRQVQTRSGAASGGAIAARLWPANGADGKARATTIDLVAMGLSLTTIDGTRAIEKVA